MQLRDVTGSVNWDTLTEIACIGQCHNVGGKSVDILSVPGRGTDTMAEKAMITKTTAATVRDAMLSDCSDGITANGGDPIGEGSWKYVNRYLRSGTTGEKTGKVENAGLMHRSGMRWVNFPEGITYAEGAVLERVMLMTSPDTSPRDVIVQKVKDSGTRFPFMVTASDKKLLAAMEKRGRGFTVKEANLILGEIGDGYSLEPKPLRKVGNGSHQSSKRGLDAVKVQADALDFLNDL